MRRAILSFFLAAVLTFFSLDALGNALARGVGLNCHDEVEQTIISPNGTWGATVMLHTCLSQFRPDHPAIGDEEVAVAARAKPERRTVVYSSGNLQFTHVDVTWIDDRRLRIVFNAPHGTRILYRTQAPNLYLRGSVTTIELQP